MRKLAIQLQKDPEPQESSISHHMYKIRLAISSKGRGKSGGARVIIYIRTVEQDKKKVVFFVSIFDKSEKEDLTPSEYNTLLGLFGL